MLWRCVLDVFCLSYILNYSIMILIFKCIRWMISVTAHKIRQCHTIWELEDKVTLLPSGHLSHALLLPPSLKVWCFHSKFEDENCRNDKKSEEVIPLITFTSWDTYSLQSKHSPYVMAFPTACFGHSSTTIWKGVWVAIIIYQICVHKNYISWEGMCVINASLIACYIKYWEYSKAAQGLCVE